MPRIELIPSDFNENDGTPTIDICERCASRCQRDGKLKGSFITMLLENGTNPPEISKSDELKGVRVASEDVEHPPYQEDNLECDVCLEPLLEEDN